MLPVMKYRTSECTDSAGKKCLSQSLMYDKPLLCPLDKLLSGIYYIRVMVDEKVLSGKFVKILF